MGAGDAGAAAGLRTGRRRGAATAVRAARPRAGRRDRPRAAPAACRRRLEAPSRPRGYATVLVVGRGRHVAVGRRGVGRLALGPRPGPIRPGGRRRAPRPLPARAPRRSAGSPGAEPPARAAARSGAGQRLDRRARAPRGCVRRTWRRTWRGRPRAGADSASAAASGCTATPKLAVMARSTPATASAATAMRSFSATSSAAAARVSGSRTMNSSPPIRPTKSLAGVRGEHDADRGEHRVAAVVPVGVVDRLEVVEVEHDRGQRRPPARRLGHHAPELVLGGAAVGQPGERVGRGPVLGQREGAQVGEDRRGERDGVVDAPLLHHLKRLGVLDQHRADDLAADEQRRAGVVAPRRRRRLALEHGRRGGARLVGPRQRAPPGRSAAARAPAARAEGRAGGSGVAASSRSWASLRLRITTRPARDGALDVPLEQEVRLALALRHLQQLGERVLSARKSASCSCIARRSRSATASCSTIAFRLWPRRGELVVAARIQARVEIAVRDLVGEAAVRAHAPDDAVRHERDGDEAQRAEQQRDDEHPRAAAARMTQVLQVPVRLGEMDARVVP